MKIQMEPKYVYMQIQCVVMLTVLCFAAGDLAKDREQCGNQLIGLVSCLPYVGGDAKLPTKDCCNDLKVVLKNSKICLCILVKDRDDPDLGLKINATLALGLPNTCHSPADVSECPSLLHLAQNSSAAKVFEDFAKTHPWNTTSPPPVADDNGSSPVRASDGGRRNEWTGFEMAYGLLIILMFHFIYLDLHDKN